MMSPETLSSLISEIYDCALDAARWPVAMTRLTAAMDAAYSAMHLFAPMEMGPPRLAATSPWDRERLEGLQLRFAPKGIPGTEDIVTRAVDLPVSSIDHVGEEAFRRTPFYREWVEPQGLLDGVVTKFVHQTDRMGILSCATSARRGPIGAEDRRFIALLCPHLRRAALIGDLLDNARMESGGLRVTLEGMRVPVILLDAGGAIVFANARAQGLLSQGTLVRSVRGRLATASGNVTAALTRAIEHAAGGDTDVDAHGIGLPLISETGPPAVAYVLPLNASDRRPRMSGAVASVFISQPSADVLPSIEVLRRLFDLTVAEARVAQLVGKGLRPADIAEMLGVSSNTVKSHLARTLIKTGTGSQTELLQLMAGLAPAFNGPR